MSKKRCNREYIVDNKREKLKFLLHTVGLHKIL